MARVCVVVLTLNEETTLEACLRSVQWADEIVVVDSGSYDMTVAVAKENGARVYTNIQDGPFQISEQRNWALDNTEITSDWIVFLDADETVGEELARMLRDQLAGSDQYDAFEMTPRYWFFGRWMKRCLNYPNWHPRVVRHGTVRFDGGVWEHFDISARIGRIKLPYEHWGNSKGFADWLSRHDRYSSWDARTVSAFLASGDTRDFETARKLGLRRLAARIWPLRPLARFSVMYFARLGFLDGWPAMLFCLRYAVYEYMTVEKVLEQRRTAAGLPL